MASDATSLIAERYARALFALGTQANALDALERDMQSMETWSKDNDDFKRFIANPLLPRQAKAKALEALLAKGRAHDITRRFASRLALNARLAALPAIAKAFDALLRQSRGELLAEVTSAMPLSTRQQKDIAQALANATGQLVRIEPKVDARLLGGFTVKIQGRLMDASVAGKLSQLATRLTHAA